MGLVTDEKVHIKSESNGSVLPTHTVGVAMDIADVGRNALEYMLRKNHLNLTHVVRWLRFTRILNCYETTRTINGIGR